MSPESFKKPRFTELHIPEVQLGYLSHREIISVLIALLRDNGLYDQHLIYCGMDGQPLKDNGTFGNRTSTWALTEQNFRMAAERSDRFDDNEFNPLAYATKSGELPAIAVFDQQYFTEDSVDGLYDGLRWKLNDGVSMDEATKAVIYFTH